MKGEEVEEPPENIDNECWKCGGDGFEIGTDPFWDEGETKPCHSCRGTGLAKDMTVW